MAHTRQTPPSQSPSVNPLVPGTAPAIAPVTSEQKPQETTAVATVTAAERTPGTKRFRLEKANGEADVIEAATVEDAIRELNSGGKGKVFTFKSLKVTEL